MLEKIIELTAETLGANAAEITAETSFMDDLHADSLDLFELAMALEEEFSVDWVRCVCQTPDMTEQEREGFLEEFQEREGTLVGFCVLGGIFSEGVDLTGESLIGAVIVGTGLPQIGSHREILKEYYDKKNHCGFDYAYRYPGMNKVLQAAGRVIRTEEDLGVVMLLDDRFGTAEYTRLFPLEWSGVQGCRSRDVGEKIEKFWCQQEKKEQT